VTAVFADQQPLTIDLRLDRAFEEYPGGPPDPVRLLRDGTTVCETAEVGVRTCNLVVPTGEQIQLVADLPRNAHGIDLRDCDEPPASGDPKDPMLRNTCFLTLTEPRTVTLRVS
jgi:hypothetical protein